MSFDAQGPGQPPQGPIPPPPPPYGSSPASRNSRLVGAVAAAVVLVGVLAVIGFLVLHGRSKTVTAGRPLVVTTSATRPPPGPSSSTPSAAASASPSSAAPSTKAAAVASSWVDTALQPVSAPVLVEGTVIVYTSDSHAALRINGIDPATGRKIWSFPSSVAASTSGQAPTVTHLADTVFFFSTALGPLHSSAQVVAVDAATGRPRWETQGGFSFTELPTLCADHLSLCDSVHWPKNALALVRIDVATGFPHVFPQGGSGRRLGPALVDPGLRSPEYLEHLDETTGSSLWRDKVSDLAGPDATSDTGWDWDRYGDVYVGSYGPRVGSSAAAFIESVRTIGVRVSDGKRLWTAAGWYGCGEKSLFVKSTPLPLRCLQRASDQHQLVQSFDVDTGKARWTYDRGNISDATGSDGGRIDAEHVALETSAGAAVKLDLVTGRTSAWTQEGVSWCSKSTTWRDPDRVDAKGKPVAMATGGLIDPCLFNGDETLPDDGTATGLGVTADGMFVWSAPEGLYGYAIPHS